ncbi:MAG: DUF1987 domain-containing protein [Cyclobacteriaceae bacterium]|nr:DUF1987 domain-containing protein [Cyclobacteriaceae bacterium]
MDNYTLQPGSKTPFMQFNMTSGVFEISGRSIPENSIAFYKPLLDWVDEYVKSPNIKTVLSIKLEYFNTSSSKCLVELFRKLESVNEKSEVTVQWYYDEEDEDMLESGQDFQFILAIPFELIPMEE